MLIDECCKKVEKQNIYWNDREYIQMLYEDGTKLNHDGDENNKKETYFDFVKYIYKEAGGNNFFDKFISSNYKREISIWRHAMESQITNRNQIFTILQKMNFREFDIDKDYGINFEEFQKCFRKSGYFVDARILQEVFNDIDATNDRDGTITKSEYKQWKKTINPELKKNERKEEEKIDENTLFYVYYNARTNRYEFNLGDDHKDSSSSIFSGGNDDTKYQHVARLNPNIKDGEGIKWALYVNKLTTSQKRKFKDKRNIPNGYWKILSDDHRENKKSIGIKSVKQEMLTKKQLQLIYQLLHHYYMLNIDKSITTK